MTLGFAIRDCHMKLEQTSRQESSEDRLRRNISGTFKQLHEFWRQFIKNRAALGGFIFVLFEVVLALLAKQIAPYDPFAFDYSKILSPPSSSHLCGTDIYGRDVLSRLVWGTRISLMVGFTAASVAFFLGVSAGSIAGYKGGQVDNIIMRFVDVMLTLPTFFLMLIIAFFFGPSTFNVVMIIGVTSWPSTARLVRAEFLSYKERDFVSAARAVGMSDMRIAFLEILPNSIFPAIVNSTLMVASTIIIEASLSFLGIGDPNVVSWGWMLQESMRALRTAPWLPILPGIAITLTVVALNVVGDGLNDALNPYLKER